MVEFENCLNTPGCWELIQTEEYWQELIRIALYREQQGEQGQVAQVAQKITIALKHAKND
jgi:hypothetical protein